MKNLFVIIFSFSAVFAFADNEGKLDRFALDTAKRMELHTECLNNKKLVKLDFNVQCEPNYHHYNSSSYRKKYSRKKALLKKKIKISEFNALHPGMSKTRFKDYTLMAKLINNFDIVGVTELIPIVGRDYSNNEKVIEFLEETPELIKSSRKEKKKLEKLQKKKKSVVRARKINLLNLKIKQLTQDLKQAKKLYRLPGYLTILNHLRELPNGKDWALILSPRGEGAATSPTQELVGYYYRSSIIKPKVNKYCKETRKIGRATPVACIVNMDGFDLGVDKSHIFSRRPFLAEFISGKFSFVLLTSHVLFDSPKDEDTMKTITQAAFGTDTYEGLGVGVTKGNYARFAEVKITLDFINSYLEKYSRYKNKDIIYMGDFNIESDAPYWSELLRAWEGSSIFINEKTSTNEARFNKDAIPTMGVTSNYDHFVFNPKTTSECVDKNEQIRGGAFNFQEGTFGKLIDGKYKVRYEETAAPYAVNDEKYKSLVKRFAFPYKVEKIIKTIGPKTLKIGKYRLGSRGIITDRIENREQGKYFEPRLLKSQLKDSSYYYFYEQIISDHLPIYMSCTNN